MDQYQRISIRKESIFLIYPTSMSFDDNLMHTHRLWTIVETSINGYYRIKNLFSQHVLNS